ncbi:MAG: L-threonylcarbamoyladenylate synthase [Gammaproteobacteria bacterium]
MSEIFHVHPDDPQQRMIEHAASIVRDGGVIVYPTDSCYALGCQLGNRTGRAQIRRIRAADRNHRFSLLCHDLSEIATYARVDNQSYRLLRQLTPGPYTFILRATGEVPKRLNSKKRETIGIRVPDNKVCQALLASLGEPLVSATLQLPEDEEPLTDPEDIQTRIERLVDGVLLAGMGNPEPTTVIDLTRDPPQVVRAGKGDVRATID